MILEDRLDAFLALLAPESASLRVLDVRQRQAGYYYSLGCDRSRVAELLDVAPDTVTDYLSRARAAL